MDDRVALHLRRAEALEVEGDRTGALQACSDALRTACEEAHDERSALGVARATLEMIRRWEDWPLLEATGKGIVAIGQHFGWTLLVMEAGYHMPYAYRGLGRNAQAREYAEVILERVREIDHHEAIAEWSSFLASLPPG